MTLRFVHNSCSACLKSKLKNWVLCTLYSTEHNNCSKNKTGAREELFTCLLAKTTRIAFLSSSS